jgi:hypothetical protein
MIAEVTHLCVGHLARLPFQKELEEGHVAFVLLTDFHR